MGYEGENWLQITWFPGQSFMESPSPLSIYVTWQGDQCSSLALSAHPCSHHVDSMYPPPDAELQVLPSSPAPSQAVMPHGGERGKSSPGTDSSGAPSRETLSSALTLCNSTCSTGDLKYDPIEKPMETVWQAWEHIFERGTELLFLCNQKDKKLGTVVRPYLFYFKGKL